MIRKLARALEWLDAVLHNDRCPQACDESHTYAWPCGMSAGAIKRRNR